MTKRFLSVILITLFSTVAMFANDISTEVQEEQKIEQQTTPNFVSTYEELSTLEKDFAIRFKKNPRNTAAVWYKYQKLIKSGIGLAIGGSTTSFVAPALFAGIGAGVVTQSLGGAIALFTFAGIFGLAGIIILSCCAVPFIKAGMLAVKYRKLYNIKLRHAAIECNALTLHDYSKNKEFGMAVSFPIK